MAEQISLGAVVVAAKDQVSCDLGGESAILSLKNGVYYSLDPVGARVWKLIEQPCTVRAVRDALLEEYEVEAERCENDLQELLGRLLSEGLIEVRG
jgi:Coenzyme PQQ synthesis protein D (PqqD)